MGEVPKQLRPYVFKKGNKLGKGRPKGKSLKEYSRDYLASMSDEERVEFLNSLGPEIIWKMAEGNPTNDSKTEINGGDIPVLVKFLNEDNRDTS